MKKIFVIIALFASTSCAIVNSPTGTGILYTDVQELIYYDPYIRPNQKTTMCSKNFLGVIALGDSGFDALKLRSSIRKIATIERTFKSRFLIVAESCLVVKGE